MSRTRPSRLGFSIVEVVLVLGAVGIILGLCGGLLHVLLRVERDGRTHFVETATLGRLARQFRQDVHAAIRAKPWDDNRPAARLELELDEGRIAIYEVRRSGLVRTQQKGAAVERREEYSLPFCRDPRFLVVEVDGRTWASLELPRSAGPEAGPKALRQDFRIEALAGRNHRLAPRRETAP